MSETLTTLPSLSKFAVRPLHATCVCVCGQALRARLCDPALSNDDRCRKCLASGLQAWFRFLLESKRLCTTNLRLFAYWPANQKAARLACTRIRAGCAECPHTVLVDFQEPLPDLRAGAGCPACTIPDPQAAILSFQALDQRVTSFCALERWLHSVQNLIGNERLTVSLSLP